VSSKSEHTNIFYDLRDVRVVNNLKLKPIHKLVLFVLESRGDEIYPSKSTIAKDCGCSKATINKALKELEAADLIYIERQFNSSNWYFLKETVFAEEAKRLRKDEECVKKQRNAHKVPNYDPWNKEPIIGLEVGKDLVDDEMDETTRIKNKQALSNMWDSLNSVSSQP